MPDDPTAEDIIGAVVGCMLALREGPNRHAKEVAETVTVVEQIDILRNLLQSKNDMIRQQAEDIGTMGAGIIALEIENSTLRTTAEVVETALSDYVLAQSRMVEGWAEGGEAVKRKLWQDLHFCEALGREALEALVANAMQPIANPSCSDGSDT